MMKIALLLTLALFLGTCERRTVAKLEGGVTPRFVLSGSGRLGTVLIFGPEQERIAESNPSDDTYALWEIEPQNEGEAGAALVEDLKVITYGVVPPGYKQIKPRTGPAPPLVPGKRYGYWFVTVNAPHAAGYFEIRDGKAVPVPGP
jgi:hypothetical protein